MIPVECWCGGYGGLDARSEDSCLGGGRECTDFFILLSVCTSWYSTTKNFPYLFWVLTWLTMWTFGGALVLFLVEEGRYSYFRCFFLAVASTTSGGLSTINVPALTSPSLTLLALLSLAGSSIMLTLLPVSFFKKSYLNEECGWRVRKTCQRQR